MLAASIALDRHDQAGGGGRRAAGPGSRSRLGAAGGGHLAGLGRCPGRAAAERGARGAVVAHGEPRTDRLFSVREVGGRGGGVRPGSHHVSTVASVPSRVGCGSRSEAVERCVSSYCTCVRGHRSRSDPAKVVQWKNTHVQTASQHLPRPTPLRLLGPTARAQSTGRPRPPWPATSLTEKRRSDRGSP